MSGRDGRLAAWTTEGDVCASHLFGWAPMVSVRHGRLNQLERPSPGGEAMTPSERARTDVGADKTG